MEVIKRYIIFNIKQLKDKIAACIILQNYLNYYNKEEDQDNILN